MRLKEERERLGFSQVEFADRAGTTRKTLFNWESGTGGPTAEVLATWADLGVDVQYIVTGQRQGQGIGESAVHQAVIDAVDLLSLGKKVDAAQLAKAVVKLCARHSAAGLSGSVMSQQTVHGGTAQQFNAPVEAVTGMVINKGKGKA
ncbi:helix-turn-helix transcriptional regulator [Zoogloea sp.]|uniref:helix-turn-helix domain-containing protein n=1 Tax=Zoogloea sp. TaxID=49181 RepID=UPI0026087C4C|nr:helix-turn-helix transcriptional regulator [Zoogloea sp.]